LVVANLLFCNRKLQTGGGAKYNRMLNTTFLCFVHTESGAIVFRVKRSREQSQRTDAGGLDRRNIFLTSRLEAPRFGRRVEIFLL